MIIVIIAIIVLLVGSTFCFYISSKSVKGTFKKGMSFALGLAFLISAAFVYYNLRGIMDVAIK